jgi:hypothetical protein
MKAYPTSTSCSMQMVAMSAWRTEQYGTGYT